MDLNWFLGSFGPGKLEPKGHGEMPDFPIGRFRLDRNQFGTCEGTSLQGRRLEKP